jgi:hydrogenase nickel incorporation protein HypA/HybF
VHELSVCQALLKHVSKIAIDRGARAVKHITLEVGPLCGIEAALLASAFEALRAGSCAAQAALSIESPAVSVLCSSCGKQSRAEPNRLVCAQCGDSRTRVVAGDELRLRRVELHVPDGSAACAQ